RKDFAVTCAGGEFGFQRLGIDAEEVKEALIEWAGVVILPVLACERGATFVEHAWQQGVAAEPGAWAARWTLREVWSLDFNVHGSVCLMVIDFRQPVLRAAQAMRTWEPCRRPGRAARRP